MRDVLMASVRIEKLRSQCMGWEGSGCDDKGRVVLDGWPSARLRNGRVYA